MIPFVGNRRRVWLLAAGVAVLALGQCGGAFAMFTDSTTAGPGSFQTGTLPIPAGLAVSNGGCSGSPTQTNVASSWTGSSALDASGNYLVAGYSVLRSPSSSGPYSSAALPRRRTRTPARPVQRPRLPSLPRVVGATP